MKTVYYWALVMEEDEANGSKTSFYARSLLTGLDSLEGFILFAQPITSSLDEVLPREILDDQVNDCLGWMDRCREENRLDKDWSDPPHAFVLFRSDMPMETLRFGLDDPDNGRELGTVLDCMYLKLARIWPAWKNYLFLMGTAAWNKKQKAES